MEYLAEGKHYQPEPRLTGKEQREFNASYAAFSVYREEAYSIAKARRDAWTYYKVKNELLSKAKKK